MPSRRSPLLLIPLLGLAACASGTEDDGASPDAQGRPDSSIDVPDADPTQPDAPPPDAFVPPDAPPPDAPPPDAPPPPPPLTCANGAQLVAVSATGLPLSISDSTSRVIDLVVGMDGFSTGAAVRFSIAHTFTGDLDVSLRGPSGVTIDLTSDNGGGGDNYTETVLTDAAAASIVDGAAPFTGQFRPEQPFSTFDTLPADGTWQLLVVDDLSSDSGTIDAVELFVCVCSAANGCTDAVPETDCANDVDDDSDGDTDCEDLGCDGVGACEYGFEASCGDSVDNDGDGLTDCEDPDCTGFECTIAACPAGTTKELYTAMGLPVAIPDLGTGTATVTVADGIVADAAVRIDIAHGYVGDVDVLLVAPGATIELTTDNGDSNDNYTGTVFVDTAATAITSGSAPYTGAYRPEQPLSSLAGAPGGAWSLQATDDDSGVAGTLNAFSLLVCRCEPGACEVGLACGNGGDDDGDGDVDCDDPDCAGTVRCAAEAACFDGADDDGDGLTDCDDPGCALDPLCTVEADCANELDDDGDGLVDCAEPTCDGIAGCTFGREDDCSDGIDNDGDGMTDAADASCAWVASLCGMGSTLHVYAAADLPKTIPDAGSVASSLVVDAAGTITATAVRFSADHGYASDLDVVLTSPGGTQRDLTSDNGGSDDNYLQTVFVDGAATSITAGSPPFTGSYRPEQPLSGLNGQAAAGTWTVTVTDDDGGITGTWTELSLAVCVVP